MRLRYKLQHCGGRFKIDLSFTSKSHEVNYIQTNMIYRLAKEFRERMTTTTSKDWPDFERPSHSPSLCSVAHTTLLRNSVRKRLWMSRSRSEQNFQAIRYTEFVIPTQITYRFKIYPKRTSSSSLVRCIVTWGSDDGLLSLLPHNFPCEGGFLFRSFVRRFVIIRVRIQTSSFAIYSSVFSRDCVILSSGLLCNANFFITIIII